MDKQHVSSSEEIREKLNALEQAEIASSSDFLETHPLIHGQKVVGILQEVVIEKLGIHYVNDGVDEEIELEIDAMYSEEAAMAYWRQ